MAFKASRKTQEHPHHLTPHRTGFFIIKTQRKIMEDKLKVGDKVVSVYINQMYGTTTYTCDIIKRLTNTRAITIEGRKMTNTSDGGYFRGYGNRVSWRKLTPEIQKEIDKEAELKEAKDWFFSMYRSRTPPREHLLIIKNHFEKLGIEKPKYK